MLAAAGKKFRAHGYAGIGVDGIAKAASVTSGAFYAHFGSKDGAFSAALAAGLDEVINAIPVFQRENGVDWVQAFADYYLGSAHRHDLEEGCAMTTLSPEVVRTGAAVHQAYEEKMRIIVERITHGLATSADTQEADNRDARAWAMLGTLIGGLTVARAVDDRALANTIATSLRHAAVQTAGPTRDVRTV
ncbi:MAG: TetR family transcriptional regulator [Rhodobiaceae bacterium]|nr:MAG: TetR family transcriptional regulator [Rhodobiaceae bacterium]